MPESQMPEMVKILLSGLAGSLVGALIGGFVIYFTTQKLIKHQNEILKKTFENGLSMVRYARSLNIRLRFLSELYDHLSFSRTRAYLPAHQLRNSWRAIIKTKGKERLLSEIREIQDEMSDSVIGFVNILNNYSYLDDLYRKFNDTLQFQSSLWNPIGIFVDSLQRLPEQPEDKLVDLIDQKGKDFSSAVDLYDKWLSDTKELIIKEQKELFEKKESIFSRRETE